MMNKRQWKWLVGAALMAAFILMALSIQSLQPLDMRISLFAAGLRAPWISRAMRFFSQLASAPVLVGLSVLLMWLIRGSRFQVPLIANLGISVILNLGIKAMITRPRPMAVPALVVETGYSFPSGHSMAGAAFYGFLIYLLWRQQVSPRARRWGTGLLAVIIALVGISRVYLGVHYLSDVVAGFLAAGFYLLVFTSFVSAYFQGNKSLGDHLPPGITPTLVMSFAHAGDGIIAGLKAERNMVIHFGVMTLVVVLAYLLRVSALEWCILLILFGMVLAAELVNTAIESAVDLAVKGPHPLARLAKDTAAGAVLVCAMVAAIVGGIILGPKLLRLLGTR